MRSSAYEVVHKPGDTATFDGIDHVAVAAKSNERGAVTAISAFIPMSGETYALGAEAYAAHIESERRNILNAGIALLICAGGLGAAGYAVRHHVVAQGRDAQAVDGPPVKRGNPNESMGEALLLAAAGMGAAGVLLPMARGPRIPYVRWLVKSDVVSGASRK